MQYINVSDLEGKERFLREYIIFRDDVFAQRINNGNRTMYVPVYETPDSVVKDHLTGRKTYGAYQLCKGQVKWVCYDIDDHDGTELAEIDLKYLTEHLSKHGVPYLVENSGSPNSYHVWIFLSCPVPVDIVYNWARRLIMKGNIQIVECEVFPKQANGNVEFGNLVKLPFAHNARTKTHNTFHEGDYLPIETVDLSKYVPKPLPKPRSKHRSGEYTRNIDCRGIRPCIEYLVKYAIPLKGTCGHSLRMAVAVEYLTQGHSEEDVAKLFQTQIDYDHDKSVYQVKSLIGHKPRKCETIRRNVMALDTDVDMNVLCKSCNMRQM